MGEENNSDAKRIHRSDEEWREMLSPEAYRVLRQNGTERPFSSPFHETGVANAFSCQGCGTLLFSGSHQFDSGCGWPSFDREWKQASVTEHLDRSHGMIRVEVRCSTCDSHLGHVFPDGPTETGKRYCINGVCLVPSEG